MGQQREKIGLWMIGACGGVGASVALGLASLRARRTATDGLVTALPPFAECPLVAPADVVVGGHEIRSEKLLTSIQGLHRRARVIDSEIIDRCAPTLHSMQRNIRPGTLVGATGPVSKLADDAYGIVDRTPASALERLANDICSFKTRHKLARVVVVNLASCEREAAATSATKTFTSLSKSLGRRGPSSLPPSSLYALAALEAGCAYVNFTPSTGIDLPALRERADQLQLPYAGRDGKTGETLVKSALAPMFAMRNLAVRSWVGQNILGNRDGAVLDDAKTRAAKIKSKDRTVSRIVPGDPRTLVSIDYVPSLDDWKIAWDFIHFEGFLGTKMSLQFVWQGCDSLLAAPLVIDLLRFVEFDWRRGASGPLSHLAFFFKDPMGASAYDLPTQWNVLCDHYKQPAKRRK